MSTDIDFLNSVQNKRLPGLFASFAIDNPFWDALMSMGGIRVPKGSGNRIEQSIASQAPSTGTGIIGGWENLVIGKKLVSDLIYVEPHRLVVPIAIPLYQMRQGGGEMAAWNIWDESPKLTVAGTFMDLDSYFMSGVGAGQVFSTTALKGLPSINGQMTGGRRPGAENGILELAAPSSQSDLIHGKTSSVASSWVNSYAAIPSYASGGETATYAAVRAAGHKSPTSKGITMVFQDSDTFTNHERARSLRLQNATLEAKTGSNSLKTFTDRGVTFVDTPSINLSNFSGVGANGVSWGIDPAHWIMWMVVAPMMSKFEDRKIGQIDAAVAYWEMQFTLMCKHRRAQLAMSGGAVW